MLSKLEALVDDYDFASVEVKQQPFRLDSVFCRSCRARRFDFSKFSFSGTRIFIFDFLVIFFFICGKMKWSMIAGGCYISISAG